MDELVLVECHVCNARVNAHVRGEITEREDFGRYVFLECPSCGSPTVAHQRALAADHRNEIIWEIARRIYPRKRSANPKIPESIRRSFEEALTCLNAKASLACVVMCRKTIESLARHHYSKIRNLVSALDQLHADKVIDERLHEWANALRETGNLAAHDPEAVVSIEDARDLVDFTEAILQYTFVLHDRFEEYKRRKAQGVGTVI